VPRIDGDTQFDTAFIQSLAIDATTDSASYTWIAGERVLVKLAPNSASAVNFIVSTFLGGKTSSFFMPKKVFNGDRVCVHDVASLRSAQFSILVTPDMVGECVLVVYTSQRYDIIRFTARATPCSLTVRIHLF
jgi:hypothetical protein